MSLVTLRKYLDGHQPETAYLKAVSLLLQAIASDPVEGDANDRESFAQDFVRIQDQIENAETQEDLLISVGAAAQTLCDYNKRTNRFILRQSNELQNMISMLTETVIKIGTGSEKSLAALHHIEQQIDRVSALEDVQTLKRKLGECLHCVREEASRQKADSENELAELRRSLGQAHERRGIDPPVDELTGLPGAQAAETALESALREPGTRFFAIAVISRIQAVNARFGDSIGDQIINIFRDHLRRTLRNGDRLFRWRGPTFVALLDRQETIDRVRAEFRAHAGNRLEATFEIGGRSVFIPITASWSVNTLRPPVAEVRRQIETFAAAQTAPTYV